MRTAAIAALYLTFAASALAHTDEALDAQASAHGGQTRMAGAYHFELVVARDAKAAAPSPVVVYVTDHAGTKVPTAGAKGTVTLLGGKAKATVALAPAGDNVLKGEAAYAASVDLKAVVTITLPGKAPEQARFTPLTKAEADPHAGHKM